ncbi:tRNA (adenosine(37)-N6)-threonylcarbamoyltransferase complex dimerization subunit type 1 TsaB [Oceanithermus sp.]|uniref:tRNA (adenosine(37)-N6)-threonylcarbamoyltransferase complex dimerization subunit type 1 TsaB n=1 Tax=Oceanithermus sp. TaxID=2268145 RepID=UPI00257A438B|nr:tRNA (adenosine(37)-N6)-threonylcarbamoyltransferase complex dimerization subunit type 1 TsaB [Oceanithermus sp.]
MNVLAVDTATPYLVLGTLDAERTLRRGRRHAETLIPDLEAFLAGVGLEPGRLELIVVGEGPGSYTGIRVAVATAMGLARGLGVPVVGASSLAAAAARAHGRVRAAFEARNRQVYTALYRVDGLPAEQDPPARLAAGALPRRDACLLWNAPPSGRALARLGLERWQRGDARLAPVYL